jgi:hypothetical protein
VKSRGSGPNAHEWTGLSRINGIKPDKLEYNPTRHLLKRDSAFFLLKATKFLIVPCIPYTHRIICPPNFNQSSLPRLVNSLQKKRYFLDLNHKIGNSQRMWLHFFLIYDNLIINSNKVVCGESWTRLTLRTFARWPLSPQNFYYFIKG